MEDRIKMKPSEKHGVDVAETTDCNVIKLNEPISMKAFMSKESRKTDEELSEMTQDMALRILRECNVVEAEYIVTTIIFNVVMMLSSNSLKNGKTFFENVGNRIDDLVVNNMEDNEKIMKAFEQPH